MQRKVLLPVLAVLALLVFGAVQTTNADVWNKKTTVTFPEWVEIPGGVVLQPGTYVMKLLDSPANRHIVQVFNDREDHVYATILAIPAQRMDPADKTIITFYETPREQPMFIRQWFYPGDTIGQEFVYPKDRAMYISSLSGTKVPVAETEVTETTKTEEVEIAQRQAEPVPEPVAEPEPVPEPQPVPEPVPEPPARDPSEAPTPSEEPQEPAPAPQAQPSTPAPTTPATPEEQEPLPQTSTSLPLLGLMAGAFAASAAVVRATRKGRG